MLLPTLRSEYNCLAASPHFATFPPSNGPIHNYGLEKQISTVLPPSGSPYMPSFSPYSTTWAPDNLLQQPLLSEVLCRRTPKEEPSVVRLPKQHGLTSVPSRRPFRISPDIFLNNPLLRGLTKELLEESWYLAGAPERKISKEEARLGIGPVGKSIFLAYARSTLDSATRIHWSCLICDASDGVTNPAYIREDRILKHIFHHFNHRPWVCRGQCGITRW